MPKKKIQICMGCLCRENFCADTLNVIENYFGQKANQKKEGREIVLETGGCMGYCSLGPNLMVDGKTYHSMTAKKTLEFLQKNFPKPKKEKSGQIPQKQKKGEFALDDLNDLLNL